MQALPYGLAHAAFAAASNAMSFVDASGTRRCTNREMPTPALPGVPTAEPPERHSLARESQRRDAHLVLVEDSASLRAAMKLLLEVENYRVTAVGSRAEALRVTRSDDAIDLVIADYHPKHDETGIDVIAALRQRLGKQLPALLLADDNSSVVNALAAHPDLVVVRKPIDADELFAMIHERLANPARASKGSLENHSSTQSAPMACRKYRRSQGRCLVLRWRNRRYSRAETDGQQQLAAVTHAARLALVGEITGSIVHEVTQPLTAILSNVETAEVLLKKRDLERYMMSEILNDVGQDARRACEIVCNIQSLLQKRELQLEPVDINSVVSNVLSLVRSEIYRRQIEVRALLDPQIPRALADPIHLQQVLLNLVINGMDALEATPPHSRRLDIRTLPTEHGIKVMVIDNGKGIEEAGLRLSIARSIIALHGASIWTEHSPSGGATFCFELPRL